MTTDMMVNIGIGTIASVTLVWGLRVLFSKLVEYLVRSKDKRNDRTKRLVLDAFGSLLRAKLLTGGYGKHRAYHVAKNGVLLAVDAADLQLANFAGVHDFWDFVSSVGDERGNPFAVSLDEVGLGNGKGDFTYVCNRCGKAFVDAVLDSEALSEPYNCARVTAHDFKNAVVHAQAKAAERNRGCYVDAFH